jgi:hypothetical protein
MSETITIRELIRRINAAIQGMSRTNPNRALLVQCGKTILELAVRTHTPEDEPIYREETVQ